MTLDGARVLVVGASAGIGRSFAIEAARAGAAVALSARRAERLSEVVEAMGGGHPLVTDVRSADDCDRMVQAALDALGGLDLVLYAAGFAPLRRVGDVEVDDLAAVFETNVFGVQHVLRAAVPHVAPAGLVAVLSSETAARPWHGLGPYASSKAAVDALLRSWRLEHPEVRVSCVTVGPTQPTEFGDAFDGDTLGAVYGAWVRQGLVPQQFMDTDELAGFLAAMLGAALAHPGIGVEQLTLRPPSPPVEP